MLQSHFIRAFQSSVRAAEFQRVGRRVSAHCLIVLFTGIWMYASVSTTNPLEADIPLLPQRGRLAELASEGEPFELKGTRWRVASSPEASWSKSGHQPLGNDQGVAFGQTVAQFKDNSLVVSGIFKALKPSPRAVAYEPTVFYKPKEKKPDSQEQSFTLEELGQSTELEICGLDGTGIGIIQFDVDWRGLTFGPVSGWRFSLSGEAITVVDADMSGLANEQDMMMYDGYTYWMPWHRITCDTEYQYYDLSISEGAMLTGKKLPLGDLGDDAVVARQWNTARKEAGVPPGVFDPALKSACVKHADYLKRNDLMAHDEDPKLPGYTDEGRRAGIASNIEFNGKSGAVRGAMGSLYHRVTMIEPTKSTLFLGGNDYAYLMGLANLGSGIRSDLPTEKRGRDYPQMSPAPSSAIEFTTLEDELPEHPAKKMAKALGYAVFARLPNFYDSTDLGVLTNVNADLSRVDGKMSQGKKAGAVKCHLSYPGFQTPKDDDHQVGLIALTPLSVLDKGVYEAHFEFTYKGVQYDLRWRFEVIPDRK